MLCLKSRHRVLTYLLPLLFVVVCSLFFGHSSVVATSQSFSFDSSSNPINYSFYDSSIVGFVPKYVSIEVSGSDIHSLSKGVLNVPVGGSTNSSSGFFDSNGYLYVLISLPEGSVYTFTSSRYGNSYFIVLTFYDSFPVGEPEPCPVCPPIPETQYGDILGKIYKAILLVPAMAFVLYLFYILFGWYVGGRR